jgi:hypothetical protein
MTYENAGGEFFPRIPYFSDPDILFEGMAVGEATSANNAKTIRQTKKLIAGYSSELPYMDNFLRDVKLSAGVLSPAFNPGIRQYAVSVPYNVEIIDIEGEANSPYSSVKGNVLGKVLSTGDNVVTIEVEDQWSNSGIRVYTVTVTREDPLPVAVDNKVFSEKDGVYPNPVRSGESLYLKNAEKEWSVKAPSKKGVYLINNKKLIVL